MQAEFKAAASSSASSSLAKVEKGPACLAGLPSQLQRGVLVFLSVQGHRLLGVTCKTLHAASQSPHSWPFRLRVLGAIYGIHVRSVVDWDEAERLLDAAPPQHELDANHLRGLLLMERVGWNSTRGAQYHTRAAQLFAAGAKAGHMWSQFHSAWCDMTSETTFSGQRMKSQLFAHRFSELALIAVQSQDALAAEWCSMGRQFDGDGPESMHRRAVRWGLCMTHRGGEAGRQTCVRAGFPPALLAEGNDMAEDAEAYSKEFTEALALLTRAAAHLPEAAFALAELLLRKRRRRLEAHDWLERATLAGHQRAAAAYEHSFAKELARGATRDQILALQKRGAELGLTSAQYWLAMSLKASKGPGAAQDRAEARRLFALASEKQPPDGPADRQIYAMSREDAAAEQAQQGLGKS